MATVDIFNLTDTWNDGATVFTAIKMDVTDTASAAGSKLIDLLVGGTTMFSVADDGALVSAGSAVQFNADSTGTTFIYGGSNLTAGLAFGHTGVANAPFAVNFSSIRLKSAANFGWTSGAINATSDVILERDAAAELAQRNGLNQQRFSVYGTFTDASNYERVSLFADANGYNLASQAAGTGTARDLRLHAGGARIDLIASGGAAGTRLRALGNGELGWTTSANAPGKLIFGSTKAATNAMITGNTSGVLKSRLADDSGYADFECADIRFGTHAAITTETLSGFITITDEAGTSRKVAVVA